MGISLQSLLLLLNLLSLLGLLSVSPCPSILTSMDFQFVLISLSFDFLSRSQLHPSPLLNCGCFMPSRSFGTSYPTQSRHRLQGPFRRFTSPQPSFQFSFDSHSNELQLRLPPQSARRQRLDFRASQDCSSSAGFPHRNPFVHREFRDVPTRPQGQLLLTSFLRSTHPVLRSHPRVHGLQQDSRSFQHRRLHFVGLPANEKVELLIWSTLTLFILFAGSNT